MGMMTGIGLGTVIFGGVGWLVLLVCDVIVAAVVLICVAWGRR